MSTYHRFTIMAACGLFLAAMTTVPTLAQPTELKAPPEVEAGVDSNVEVLTRGTLHEAFATPTTFDPVELPIIKQRPPEAIEELPPDHRPAGDSVIWIPGYWQFDNERDDFIWLSGVWRNVPPGRQWVPGYWSEVDNGYRWIPGVWVEANSQVSYQPPPPQSQERGPSAQQPSDNHFYAPGTTGSITTPAINGSQGIGLPARTIGSGFPPATRPREMATSTVTVTGTTR